MTAQDFLCKANFCNLPTTSVRLGYHQWIALKDVGLEMSLLKCLQAGEVRRHQEGVFFPRWTYRLLTDAFHLPGPDHLRMSWLVHFLPAVVYVVTPVKLPITPDSPTISMSHPWR